MPCEYQPYLALLVNCKSIILEGTPERNDDKQVGLLSNQSPERLNALFDRIKDCRVDIEWMERREFEV